MTADVSTRVTSKQALQNGKASTRPLTLQEATNVGGQDDAKRQASRRCCSKRWPRSGAVRGSHVSVHLISPAAATRNGMGTSAPEAGLNLRSSARGPVAIEAARTNCGSNVQLEQGQDYGGQAESRQSEVSEAPQEDVQETALVPGNAWLPQRRSSKVHARDCRVPGRM